MVIPETICQHMLKLKEKATCINLQRHDYLYLENQVSDRNIHNPTRNDYVNQVISRWSGDRNNFISG